MSTYPGAVKDNPNIELRRQNERLSFLSDVAGLLLLNDNPREILDYVFRMLSAHLGLEAYFNYLVTDDGSRMRLYEYGGIPGDMAKDIEWLEYGQAVCGRVALDRERIVVEDVQCSSDEKTDLIRSLGITAYCCHPLIAHGKLIGTLSFGTRGRSSFSDDEIALMHTVCDLVATSLEHAKLISSLKKSQIDLEEKVKERTLELREKKDELETQAEKLEAQNHELQKSNDALRKAEEVSLRLALIVESSDSAIVGKTPDGIITSWNQGAEKMFGFSAREAIGKSISILSPPGHRDEIPDILNSIKNGEHVENLETVRRRKDGTLIDISLSVSPIKDRSGKIIGASSIKRDITERKRTEEALRKNEEMLRRVIDSSPIPMVLHNESEEVIFANKKFTGTFGYTIEDIPSIHEWWVLAYPDVEYREFVKKRWYTATDHAIKNDVSIPPREVEVTCKDGSKRQVLSEFSSIGNINLSILYDITDRKRSEEELKIAKAQAELYLDLMGHDINNMNQSAMGFLELALETLEMDGNIGPDGKILIEKPLQAINNSSRLIENVRKLQRLMTDGIKNRPVDLYGLFNELRGMNFHSKDHDVIINVEHIPHYVVDGSELLRDVFFNLINNAVKHSMPDRPVTVNVSAERIDEDGRVFYRCEVEDDGPGIPDDMKTRLFHRFQRGKTHAHGKGLGLYLVRVLVESYHGKVRVEDRVPGDHTRGARFVVILPAIEK